MIFGLMLTFNEIDEYFSFIYFFLTIFFSLKMDEYQLHKLRFSIKELLIASAKELSE